MFGKCLRVATFTREEVIKIVANSNCENSTKGAGGAGKQTVLGCDRSFCWACWRFGETLPLRQTPSGARTRLSSSRCQGRSQPGELHVFPGRWWARACRECTEQPSKSLRILRRCTCGSQILVSPGTAGRLECTSASRPSVIKVAVQPCKSELSSRSTQCGRLGDRDTGSSVMPGSLVSSFFAVFRSINHDVSQNTFCTLFCCAVFHPRGLRALYTHH